MPGPGPGQVLNIELWASEPRWRAKASRVAVQRGQNPAEVGNQAPGRRVPAASTLDPGEPDAAPAARKLRCGHVDAEPGDGDGQVGVTGKGSQPDEFGVKLGVCADTGQAHPDQQALTVGGVTTQRMAGVLPHPAQPTGRYALIPQRAQDQVAEVPGPQGRAVVHATEYPPRPRDLTRGPCPQSGCNDPGTPRSRW